MNGFDLGSVIAHVKADIGDFKDKMNEAKGITSTLKTGISKLGDGFDELRKQSSVLAIAGIGALTYAAKESVDAFNDSQKELAQLDAVLKSTKNAAGLTRDEVVKLAASLQKQTTFSDEAVLSAENLLLTFTNIKKNVFPQATQTVLDMSVALGQDTKSSAIQLGKALQDPILGITALRRVGVNFSDAQKTVIEKLVNTGHSLEAQKMILKELSTEFGGSASAQAQTFAGKLEILKNAVNDIQEGIGKLIIDAITPFVTAISNFVTSGGLDAFIKNIQALAQQYLPPFLAALQAVGAWINENQALVMTFLQGLAIALGALMVLGTINLLVTALLNPLVLVGLAIGALYVAWQTNFMGIQDVTTTVINFVMDFFTNTLMPFIEVFVGFWTDRWIYIQLILEGAWQIIVGIIQVAWALVYGIISVGLELLAGDWDGAWKRIKQTVAIAWDGIKNIFEGIIKFISGWGFSLINELVKPFEEAWNKISALVNKIKDALDFTKRHSPSVIDIVQMGVGKVNKALEGLEWNTNVTPQMAGAAIMSSGPSSNLTSVNIDMSGAYIGDEYAAQQMGEKIGDSIIKKLQKNIRF